MRLFYLVDLDHDVYWLLGILYMLILLRLLAVPEVLLPPTFDT